MLSQCMLRVFVQAILILEFPVQVKGTLRKYT